MASAAIQTITILGGGTAGWMSAALLARRLGPGGVRITLVESDEIGTIGVGEATVPLIRHFNDALGIDEADFLCATQGTYKLGIEFCDWGRPGNTHFHGFGDYGEAIDGLSPHHYWLRRRGEGDAAAIDEHSLPYALARRGKFAPADPRVPAYAHAYHFDATLYAGYLRRLAESWGVTRVEGRVRDVPLDGETGHIRALTMEDGRSIGGDFFIDCSGFAALLIGRALGTDYLDWSRWLPCDSALAVPCVGDGAPAPFTRSTARAAGWQWRIPLQHREGNGYVYASAHINDAEAEVTLLANLAGAPLAAPRRIRFTPGRRAQFWRGNCVAVGFAGGFLEPLESSGIQLIQNAISRFIEFFPARPGDPAIAAEYNRVTALEWERIRDFLIAHYCLSQRSEPLWAACRAMPIPETLQHKLDVWRACGRVPLYDQDSYLEPSWVAILLGNGCVPDAWHPAADMPPIDALGAAMARRRADLARLAQSAPDHRAYIARTCKAEQ